MWSWIQLIVWNGVFNIRVAGCHSRLFLAGIQAEFGLEPRLKHSGVTASCGILLSREQRVISQFVENIGDLRYFDGVVGWNS
jgi:hypothetical protein